MQINKKIVDPATFEAHIILDKGELNEHIRRVTDELTQQVAVQGFRKGKAPKELAEQQLDPNIVRQEALQRALEDSFSKAAENEHWDVMRTSDLKMIKNDADGLEYSIRVVVWPATKVPDLSTVKVPRQAVVVSDAEIEEALDTVRNMRATFLDKTGSAAQGDRVEIDFDAKIGGIPVQGGQSQNHPLIIGGKNFMPGFEEELVGLTSGQTKEFALTAPEDYYEANLAGKKVDFTVTVRRVQSVLKPDADDAFAASLGAFKSIDELKANLRAGIMREKADKERQRLRLAILDATIAASTVSAPQELVTQELEDMVHRFSDDLKGRGIELPMYLARLKKTEDDLRKDWKPEAERQVKIMLVIRQIAKDRNIIVEPEELEQAVTGTVAELMKSGQVQEDQIDPERLRAALGQRILTDKTLQVVEKECAVDQA